METQLYQLQGNEYRLTPFKIPRKKFCDFYETERPLNSEYYEAFNLPEGCPIPKSNYTGQFIMQFKTIPPNFNGKYKIVMKYYYKGEYVDTLIIFAEVHHYFV
jgi:hypothetical protein